MRRRNKMLSAAAALALAPSIAALDTSATAGASSSLDAWDPTPASPSVHQCVLGAATQRRSLARMRPDAPPVLQSIAHNTHAFSFILADDALMLRHWLRHYLRIGILPSHVHIAIRMRRSASAAALAETRQALDAANVPSANVELIHSPPSDDLKLTLINRQMDSLPKGSWFIYADVDEHFDYFCGIRPQAMRSCITGIMYDQLARNGNISEATDEPHLTDQYPLMCQIRAIVLPRMKNYKTILVNVGGKGHRVRRFRNTHSVNDSCTTGGISRHYMMTLQTMRGNAQKAALIPGAVPAPAVAPPPKKRPTRAVVPITPSPNWANGTCGNPSTKTGKCLDYYMLYDFMRKQLKAVDRHGSSYPWKLCKDKTKRLPLEGSDLAWMDPSLFATWKTCNLADGRRVHLPVCPANVTKAAGDTAGAAL